MKIEHYGNRGIVFSESGVLTFEVQGLENKFDDFEKRVEERKDSFYSKYMNEYSGIRIGNRIVPAWGDNNLYPQAVFTLISANKLIPQILEKQAEYMFGRGPYLYKEVVDGRDIVKEPVQDREVEDWLKSWESNGLMPYEEYLLQTIQEYYHIPANASKFIFSKSRRLVSLPNFRSIGLPVMGLEKPGLENIRLATKKINVERRFRINELEEVCVGDWLNPVRQNFEFYDKFDPANPYKSSTAYTFNRNKSFTKEVYPLNRWFEGSYDWIKGANLTPKFINSYLKNALNARIHVLIPGAWVEKHKTILTDICANNRMGETPQPIYGGVLLMNPETSEYYDYKEWMIEQLIQNKLKEITRLMSGEGKNQGKLWASIKYNIGNSVEEWEFKEIPSNYKDFITALTDYDKRADQVVLAGVGINSSISNVEKDGVISKSGSDVFYNYMIYINSLAVPEYFICQDINRAIRLNFPDKNLKLGLYHRTPPKTSDISPNNRMEEVTE